MCAGDPVGGLSCIASCTDTEQMKHAVFWIVMCVVGTVNQRRVRSVGFGGEL